MSRILCFDEVLWDCLPSGRLPGGAPLNVAYHLHRLGCEAHIISAVGCDALGDEMLTYLGGRGLSTRFIHRHELLPTGTVEVTLRNGQPSYEIRSGVAWDEIPYGAEVLELARTVGAIVFGSLATRTAANRVMLERLLATGTALKLMDVNLRPPFDDHPRALGLAAQADVIKLNEQELAVLTGMPADDERAVRDASAALAEITGCRQICITQGAAGASIWDEGQWLFAPAPRVELCDAIGAGDAFTAAMLRGLLEANDRRAGLKTLQEACALGALVASLPGGQPRYERPEPVGSI